MKSQFDMAGEKNLATLLTKLDLILNNGIYVFSTLKDASTIPRSKIIAEFKEQESTTLVLSKEDAIQYNLDDVFESSWITCKVHSSLEAVGLTATFAKALSGANIPCNVIAGFYHDHIFVPYANTDEAMVVLKNLSGKSEQK